MVNEEAVEAGARAIVAHVFTDEAWDTLSEPMKDRFRKQFRIGFAAALQVQHKDIHEFLKLTDKQREKLRHEGFVKPDG